MSAIESATAILSTASEPVESSVSQVETPPADSNAPESIETSEAVTTSSPDGEEGSEGGAAGGEAPPSQPPTTAAIRAALKAFRESSPEHAQAVKLLNDGYSRYEAYKEVIPSVEEARTIRASLDSVGGIEGLASLQGIVNNIEETDSMIEQGNPEVLDRIIEDSPEGFAKLASPYLEKLAKLNPEAFQAAVQPHFVRGLIDSKFPRVMDYLSSKMGDKPELKEIVDSVRQWFSEQKSLAEKSNQDALAPERQQLLKERETLRSEQRKSFEAGIGTEMNTHIQSELGSRLKPFAASLNTLTPAMRLNVAQACMTELAKALSNDKAYKTQADAMMNAKKPDRARILTLNKTKVTSLADAVIAKVAKEYGLKVGAPAKPGTKTATATKAAPTSTELIKVAKQPADGDIDWDFPGAKQAFITHRAALKVEVAKARGLKSRFVKW
jgi:hypothetical protein